MTLLAACSPPPTPPYFSIQGFAEGTSYSITYSDEGKRDFRAPIEQLLNEFEISLSTYRDSSIISRANRNEEVELDDYFITVFNRSAEVSAATNNAFDISASPLFSIWGWGAEKRKEINQALIDSLKQYVGMDKVRIENRRLIKDHPNVTLNMNAIAKGYSSDVVAKFLDEQGVQNYLVEIGGEMRLKGKNSKGNLWRVGVDKPMDGNYMPGENLQTILEVTDLGLATSGDYRRFYIDSLTGEKYSHTIDPKTGYSAKQGLLSATVIAPDCMTADAYATAFMVLGVDSSKKILERMPELEAYFVYNEKGENKVFYTNNMKHRIVEP